MSQQTAVDRARIKTQPEMRVPVQRVARNASYLVVGQFLIQVILALNGILVARFLGDAIYGQYTAAFAFAGIFGLAFTLGVDALIVREIARSSDPDKARESLRPAIWLRIVAMPLALALIAFAATAVNYAMPVWGYIMIVALILGINGLADLGRAVFQGLQRMQYDTLTRLFDKFIGMATIVILLAAGVRALDAILLALLAAAVAGLVASWAMAYRMIGWPKLGKPHGTVKLMRAALPIGGSLALVSLYLQLPTVILSWFAPDREVGLFGAANGTVSPFFMLPVALGTALLPALAQSVSNDERTLRLHLRYTGLGLFLGALVTVALLIGGYLVLEFLYGEQFIEAIPAMRVLALVVPLIFANTYLTNYLIAQRRHKRLPAAAAATLIMTAIFSLVFIRSFGFAGAALARVCAELGNFAILFVMSIYQHAKLAD
ncbi:MAG: oligosaccharide flippase family protein [Chloroflexi bacterium]|nr:oligosaccharide flippase family protein [Chloroflexota bacterium]